MTAPEQGREPVVEPAVQPGVSAAKVGGGGFLPENDRSRRAITTR